MIKRIYIVAFLTSFLINQEMSAETILDSMTAVLSPQNFKAMMRQIIQTTNEQERIFEYDYFSGNNGENLLMRYVKPKKIKGNAFLIKNSGDDIWVYFPRTRRTRKLASHAKKQKVQGSDFSYEDYSGSNTWKEDYHYKRLEDPDKDLFQLEFLPKPDVVTSYSKMEIVLQQSDFYPIEMKYYNEKRIHLKTLYFEDISEVEGFTTALKMRMTNHQEGTETRMEIINITYDIKYDDNFFTERSLKRK